MTGVRPGRRLDAEHFLQATSARGPQTSTRPRGRDSVPGNHRRRTGISPRRVRLSAQTSSYQSDTAGQLKGRNCPGLSQFETGRSVAGSGRREDPEISAVIQGGHRLRSASLWLFHPDRPCGIVGDGVQPCEGAAAEEQRASLLGFGRCPAARCGRPRFVHRYCAIYGTAGAGQFTYFTGSNSAPSVL
jgi:hypothetical protein